MDFLQYLQGAGPFTAPLCVAMVFAIRYLLKQMAELKLELKEARRDAIELREKRATDLQAAALEYKEQGEATRNVLSEWNAKADAALGELRRRNQ